MTNIGTQIRERSARVADRISCEADVDALDDAGLTAAMSEVAALRQSVDHLGALFASSLARRSRPEFGSQGLARRNGFVSPEAMIQSIGGGSRRDAAALIQVGDMLDQVQAAEAAVALLGGGETDSTGADEPNGTAGLASSDMPAPDLTPLWQRPLSTAMQSNSVSAAQAQALLAGLGCPDEAVTADELGAALVEILAVVDESAARGHRLTVEELHKAARLSRASIDNAMVVRREQEHRQQNYLRVWRQATGRVEIHGSLDPESGTHVLNAIQGAVSPKSGGPRFVDTAKAARAAAIADDPRTPDQMRADVLVDLIRLGTEADPGTVFGSKRAAVRVVVTENDLAERTGFGAIEGCSEPISLESVDRHLCDSGFLGIKFDSSGQSVLNLGRTKRFFSSAQRVVLAVRDGGCMWPGCDRPPSWTEAHHTKEWHDDEGPTDIDDGILLCRTDHLRLHNEGWQITRQDSAYFLIPPRHIDREQQAIRLHSKSALSPRLLAS